jgi:hypothetical protein
VRWPVGAGVVAAEESPHWSVSSGGFGDRVGQKAFIWGDCLSGEGGMPWRQRPTKQRGTARWGACTEAANGSGWPVRKGARGRRCRRQLTGDTWVALLDADEAGNHGSESKGRQRPMGKRKGWH